MPYVPPHKRVAGAESSVRPTPVAPPSSRKDKQPWQGNYRGSSWKPDVDIKYARNNIREWFAVHENGDPSNLLLKFNCFPGESFEHLRGEKLYTLSPTPGREDDVENDLRSLSIHEGFYPWTYIWGKIKEDLKNAYQNVGSYMEISKPEYAKPTLAARLGKILFHNGGLAWDESISVDSVAKMLKREIVLQNPLHKTFDTHIPKHIFDALKEKTIVGLEAPTIRNKERYIIQVEDSSNPRDILRLTCRKSIDGTQLELIKIKLEPVRHFVTDISCLDKPIDLRLALFTEKYMTNLSEDDREGIESIVKSACIEGSVKGGLHWPLGGDLRRGRFRVKGAWHHNVTNILWKLWNLRFLHANRAEFKACSGRVTCEVTLKHNSINEYLKDQRQWEEENMLDMLEGILKWVWTECLNSSKILCKNANTGK